jgi:hypothetical protein
MLVNLLRRVLLRAKVRVSPLIDGCSTLLKCVRALFAFTLNFVEFFKKNLVLFCNNTLNVFRFTQQENDTNQTYLLYSTAASFFAT